LFIESSAHAVPWLMPKDIVLGKEPISLQTLHGGVTAVLSSYRLVWHELENGDGIPAEWLLTDRHEAMDQ
jgi:hypothetical protein